MCIWGNYVCVYGGGGNYVCVYKVWVSRRNGDKSA